MSSLAATLAATRAQGRAALIGYLPAGFPTIDGCVDVITTMVDNGVDIVEVGLPYSDPLMDGPVIQDAVTRSLANGTTTAVVLDTVKAVAATGAPTLVMSYWNPIERFGVARFAQALGEAGGCGVITPDLTPEEATDWIEATDRHRIDRVFVVAPSSTSQRLATVTGLTSGFVYAASTMGVTGARASVAGTAATLVQRVRTVTDLPVCVGLGVSTGDQAAEVAGDADGVIVGSAFVKALQQADSVAHGLTAVAKLASELAAGVRSGHS